MEPTGTRRMRRASATGGRRTSNRASDRRWRRHGVRTENGHSATVVRPSVVVWSVSHTDTLTSARSVFRRDNDELTSDGTGTADDEPQAGLLRSYFCGGDGGGGRWWRTANCVISTKTAVRHGGALLKHGENVTTPCQALWRRAMAVPPRLSCSSVRSVPRLPAISRVPLIVGSPARAPFFSHPHIVPL